MNGLQIFTRGFDRPRGLNTAALYAVLAAFTIVGCSKQPQQQSVKTQPADTPMAKPAETAPVATLPATSQPAATQPAATQPVATRPASTYDSKPPYPVNLYVMSPDEKQTGWLKITGLVNDQQIATAAGTFPEKNRIYVDTANVRQIRIHVGHLPLAAKERVILQIDEQGMVLSKTRPYTNLERRPTGEWVVVKEPKPKKSN